MTLMIPEEIIATMLLLLQHLLEYSQFKDTHNKHRIGIILQIIFFTGKTFTILHLWPI